MTMYVKDQIVLLFGRKLAVIETVARDQAGAGVVTNVYIRFLKKNGQPSKRGTWAVPQNLTLTFECPVCERLVDKVCDRCKRCEECGCHPTCGDLRNVPTASQMTDLVNELKTEQAVATCPGCKAPLDGAEFKCPTCGEDIEAFTQAPPAVVSPTKAQEIETYRKFVESQPAGSYLRSILIDTIELVSTMIGNDFNYSLGNELRKLDRERLELIEQIKQAGKVAEELRSKSEKLSRDCEQADETLRSIRAQARALADA